MLTQQLFYTLCELEAVKVSSAKGYLNTPRPKQQHPMYIHSCSYYCCCFKHVAHYNSSLSVFFPPTINTPCPFLNPPSPSSFPLSSPDPGLPVPGEMRGSALSYVHLTWATSLDMSSQCTSLHGMHYLLLAPPPLFSLHLSC